MLRLRIEGADTPPGTVEGSYCHGGRITLSRPRLAFTLEPRDPPCAGDRASMGLWGGTLQYGCEVQMSDDCEADAKLGGLTCGDGGGTRPQRACDAVEAPADAQRQVASSA